MQGQSHSSQEVPRSVLGVRKSCAAPPPRGSTQSHWPRWYSCPLTQWAQSRPGLCWAVLTGRSHSQPQAPGPSCLAPGWPHTHMASSSLVSPWATSADSRSFVGQWYIFLWQEQIPSGAPHPHPVSYVSPPGGPYRALTLESSQIEVIVPETCSLTPLLPLPFPRGLSHLGLSESPQALNPVFPSHPLLGLDPAGHNFWQTLPASSRFMPRAPLTLGLTAAPL